MPLTPRPEAARAPWDRYDSSLGEHFYKARRRRYMSLRAVADEINADGCGTATTTSVSTLWRVEEGHVPSLVQYVTIVWWIEMSSQMPVVWPKRKQA